MPNPVASNDFKKLFNIAQIETHFCPEDSHAFTETGPDNNESRSERTVDWQTQLDPKPFAARFTSKCLVTPDDCLRQTPTENSSIFGLGKSACELIFRSKSLDQFEVCLRLATC